MLPCSFPLSTTSQQQTFLGTLVQHGADNVPSFKLMPTRRCCRGVLPALTALYLLSKCHPLIATPSQITILETHLYSMTPMKGPSFVGKQSKLIPDLVLAE